MRESRLAETNDFQAESAFVCGEFELRSYITLYH